MNKNMNYTAPKIHSFAYLDLERSLSILLCSLGSLDFIDSSIVPAFHTAKITNYFNYY